MTDKTRNMSTAALAYLGDSVVEICVRTFLAASGIADSRHLNEEALKFVRAGAQASASHKILPFLTEEETAVYKRGRNLGHSNVPKSASVSEYRQATGFEALFGFLHAEGEEERVNELFSIAYADEIKALCEKIEKGDFK